MTFKNIVCTCGSTLKNDGNEDFIECNCCGATYSAFGERLSGGTVVELSVDLKDEEG